MRMAWWALCDVLRYWFGRFSRVQRLHRRLRGPSPATYETEGYQTTECYRAMNYWVLELRHIKSPNLGWVPWAVLKGGHIREHLKLVEQLPARVAGIEDGRIRPIDVIEGQRLANGGITVWGKH